MHKFTKRTTAILVGIVVAAGASTVAYAYWTAGGTGSGSAATGTSVALIANQTSAVTDVGPGDAPQAISGNFDNPDTGPAYVTSVTVSISDITGDGPGASCEATDYLLVNPVSDVNAQVPAGDDQRAWGTVDIPTIQFNNKAGENQNDCKNATVVFLLTIL